MEKNYEPYNPETFAEACQYIAGHCQEVSLERLTHDKNNLANSLKYLTLFVEDLSGVVHEMTLSQIGKMIDDARMITATLDHVNMKRVLPEIQARLADIKEVVTKP